MTASSSVTVSSMPEDPSPRRLRWDHLLHASHGYLLPVLSGLGFVLGGILLVQGPATLGRLAPLAFLAFGVGAFIGSVAYRRGKGFSGSTGVVTPPPGASFNPAPVCSQCAGSIRPAVDREDFFRDGFLVSSPGGKAAPTLRVLFSPTSAADQLQVHWLPSVVGELPSELTGPIPETAYFPPDAESPLASADLAPGMSPVYDPQDPVETVALDPPLSPGTNELSRLEAPDLTAIPVLTGPDSSREDDRPSPAVAPPPETPRWMRSILAEAMNPVPPHLRSEDGAFDGRATALRAGPDSPGPTGPSDPR
jgi:hypothetical protein